MLGFITFMLLVLSLSISVIRKNSSVLLSTFISKKDNNILIIFIKRHLATADVTSELDYRKT